MKSMLRRNKSAVKPRKASIPFGQNLSKSPRRLHILTEAVPIPHHPCANPIAWAKGQM